MATPNGGERNKLMHSVCVGAMNLDSSLDPISHSMHGRPINWVNPTWSDPISNRKKTINLIDAWYIDSSENYNVNPYRSEGNIVTYKQLQRLPQEIRNNKPLSHTHLHLC